MTTQGTSFGNKIRATSSLPQQGSSSESAAKLLARRGAVIKLFSGKFAVDIDETLAATATSWIRLAANDLEIPLSQSPHQLHCTFGLVQDVPEISRHPKFKQWLDNELKNTDPARHMLVEPMEGALESLKSLTQRHGGKIECYLTARKEFLHGVTEQWLDKHGFPEAPIIFSPPQVAHEDRNLWKAKFLRIRRYISGIIDDQTSLADLVSPHYHGVVVSVVAQSAQLRRPRRLGERHVRCSNWPTLASLAGVKLPP